VGVGAGVCMYDVVVKKFTFAISSPGEFLVRLSVVKYPHEIIIIIVQYLYSALKSCKGYRGRIKSKLFCRM